MKFNKNLLREKWFSYTVALCSAVVLYLLLTHVGAIAHFLKGIWNVGAPVFMAFVIAYVLDPLVMTYSKYLFSGVEQEKARHAFSVLLSILTVVLFFVVLMVALVPQVVQSIVMFVGNLNGYVLSFQRLMRQLNSFAAQHDIDLSQFISSSDELLQSITRILPENVNKIVNASYGFGTKLFDWIISFILAIYLMLDGAKLRRGFVRLMHALMPTGVYRSTASFWSRCNRILVQYIAFDVLDGMIIGILNWIFMVVMQMPYVAIISVIVGATNLAPTFGPMVGAVIGSFILVLVKPVYALWFLLFTLVLQTVDGYVIKPRLFGESLGVSSVWILISLVIGGRLLGVPGILLAIPFAAIADFVYHDYIIVRLENQKAERRKLKAAAEAGQEAAALRTAAAAAGVSEALEALEQVREKQQTAQQQAAQQQPAQQQAALQQQAQQTEAADADASAETVENEPEGTVLNDSSAPSETVPNGSLEELSGTVLNEPEGTVLNGSPEPSEIVLNDSPDGSSL